MFPLLAFGIGTQELLIILAIVVVLFGATKLPKLGSAVGEGIKNFRKGIKDASEETPKETPKLADGTAGEASPEPAQPTDSSDKSKA